MGRGLRRFRAFSLSRRQPAGTSKSSAGCGPTRMAVTVETVSCVSPRTLTRVRVSRGNPGRARIAASRPPKACAAPDHSRKSAKIEAPAGRSSATQTSTLACRPRRRKPRAACPAIVRRPSSATGRRSSSPPIIEAATDASACERARRRATSISTATRASGSRRKARPSSRRSTSAGPPGASPASSRRRRPACHTRERTPGPLRRHGEPRRRARRLARRPHRRRLLEVEAGGLGSG